MIDNLVKREVHTVRCSHASAIVHTRHSGALDTESRGYRNIVAVAVRLSYF
jgi:hypothetical protein